MNHHFHFTRTHHSIFTSKRSYTRTIDESTVQRSENKQRLQIPLNLYLCIMNQQILRIAFPSIISNITIPLLALADTTIVGHLGKSSYIGAIALGGMVFNMAYWLFGFLRMGTGGLTAQAYGRGDEQESTCVLLRSLFVALGISMLLWLLQRPIIDLTLHFVTASPEVATNARNYYQVLIWGAPAVLGLYSLTGWFLGMQDARVPMLTAILQNVVNISASCLLVFGFHLKIRGVAAGTLIAQYTGFAIALGIWFCRHRHALHGIRWTHIVETDALKKFFSVNRDIFLRTLCLIAVTSYFTSFGSAQGELILAANTLLMQFFILFSYVMDGFAYAGEALGGRFCGAGSRKDFNKLTRYLFGWGIALVAIYSATYAITGRGLLRILTSNSSVVTCATDYLPYACAVPVASFTAFLFDGLFIGTTSTRFMLFSMMAATATFFLILECFPASNSTLWMAFLAYLACRGIVQATLFPKVKNKLGGLAS